MEPTDRRVHLDAAASEASGGRVFCRALAAITDDWLIDLFEMVMDTCGPRKGRIALVALGGYGRGELAPFSDLDLLLVHDLKRRKVDADIAPLASALWYPLWDSGVRLGHAVRRLDEQVDLASSASPSASPAIPARPHPGSFSQRQKQ